MKHSRKIFIAVIACILFALSSAGCNNTTSGIPDPTANINQFVKKSENWRQIVQDRTPFLLGEPDEEPFRTTERQDWNGSRVFGDYRWSYGDFPAIDGSTVLIPMAAEFVWQWTDISAEQYLHSMRMFEADPTSDTLTFLNFSTTSTAYDRLINGGETDGFIRIRDEYEDMTHEGQPIDTYRFNKRPDIVIATHPSEAELQTAATAGIALTIEPICFDSFVFITHKDNPVDSLTVEQIRQIYSGEIKNWKKVGGKRSKITAYQREANSGSQTYMEETVMKGKKLKKAPQTKVRVGMGGLVDAVAGYENGTMSIGYTYKYYIDKLYANPDIKILQVDGVAPSDENVRNNSYAFIAAYNAVIRASDTDEVASAKSTKRAPFSSLMARRSVTGVGLIG